MLNYTKGIENYILYLEGRVKELEAGVGSNVIGVKLRSNEYKNATNLEIVGRLETMRGTILSVDKE